MKYLLGNRFFKFGAKIYQQSISNPMGSDPGL